MCNLIKKAGCLTAVALLFISSGVLAKPYSLSAYNRGESAGDQYLSFSVGPQIFVGDLFFFRIKRGASPMGFSPAATFGYRYQYSDLLGFKGKLLLGTLSSPQYDTSNLDTPFSRFYGGVSGSVEFELLQMQEVYDQGRQELVVGVGIGAYVSAGSNSSNLMIHPISDYYATPTSANEMKVSFILPVNVAYYYPLSDQLHIFAEGIATLITSEVDIQTRGDVWFNGTLSLQLGLSYKF